MIRRRKRPLIRRVTFLNPLNLAARRRREFSVHFVNRRTAFSVIVLGRRHWTLVPVPCWRTSRLLPTVLLGQRIEPIFRKGWGQGHLLPKIPPKSIIVRRTLPVKRVRVLFPGPTQKVSLPNLTVMWWSGWWPTVLAIVFRCRSSAWWTVKLWVQHSRFLR